MKKIIILLLLVVPLAQSQNFEPLIEDFEDDTLGLVVDGSNPNADWYSPVRFYGNAASEAACSTSTRYQKIVAGTGTTDGAIDGKSLRIQSSNNVYCGMILDFTPSQTIGEFSFDAHMSDGTSSDTHIYRMRLFNSAGGLIVDSWFRSSAAGNLEFRLNAFTGSNDVSVCSFVTGIGNTPSTDHYRVKFDLNFASQTYTASITIPGCTPQTVPFRSASTAVGDFRIQDASSFGGTRHIVVDNFGVESNVPIAPPLDDFDTGFKKIIADFGFKSPESQMLFAIIFITLMIMLAAWITSFFGEGPRRIWIIHGVASVSGIIMVLLTFLELWVYTLAFVLATVQVKGDFGWINTFNKKPALDDPVPSNTDGFIDPDEVSTIDPDADMTTEDPPESPSTEGETVNDSEPTRNE